MAGYSPLFVSGHWDPVIEARCIETLRSRRVDGVIVLTGRLPDAALCSLARSMPVVVTGRELSAPNLYALQFDNFEGGRLATQHLIDLGHKEIAFITGDTDHPDSNERLRGYRSALESAGLPFRPALVVPGQYHELSGLQAVDQLVASGESFSAIFAANDQMAVGVALGLKRNGLNVPEDVSLVGFDDLPSSLYTIPPLSSVHHPAYESGRLAAASILALLAGKVPDACIPAPQVVVRESSRGVAA
jgi:LacI family transcriptional regulator